MSSKRDDSMEQDTESFLVYLEEKITTFEEEISLIYTSLHDMIKNLQSDCPSIDPGNKTKNLHEENIKYEKKVSHLTERNVFIEGEFNDLKEETETKDNYIKRLEEEIVILQKENEDILSKVEEIEMKEIKDNTQKAGNFLKLNSFNQNYIQLNEEKSKLEIENTEFNSKIRYLENEIKTKYILKSESNNQISSLEKENKNLINKLKSFENRADQLKHEYNTLRSQNDGLRHSISAYERKIEKIKNNTSSNHNLVNLKQEANDSSTTPLNLLFEGDDVPEEGSLENKHSPERLKSMNSSTSQKEKENTLKFESKKNSHLSILQINNCSNSKDQIIYGNTFRPNTKRSNQNNNNNLFDELKGESTFLEDHDNKVTSIGVTPNEIIQKMEKNELYDNIIKINRTLQSTQENGRADTLANIKPKIEIPKLNLGLRKDTIVNTHQGYRDFFQMTFQSIKLNCDDIEPFLYLDVDHLFQFTMKNKIPFHKFALFIKKEYEKVTSTMKKRLEMKKNRYDAVIY